MMLYRSPIHSQHSASTEYKKFGPPNSIYGSSDDDDSGKCVGSRTVMTDVDRCCLLIVTYEKTLTIKVSTAEL